VTVTAVGEGYTNYWYLTCTIPSSDLSTAQNVYISLYARDANNNFPDHPIDPYGIPLIYIDYKDATGSVNTVSNWDYLGKVVMAQNSVVIISRVLLRFKDFL